MADPAHATCTRSYPWHVVLCRELQAVSESCEAVITCGGVGPTVDDCTVEAVAMAMGTHVSTNAEFANSLRSYFGDKVSV